jgi:hypothetical protein
VRSGTTLHLFTNQDFPTCGRAFISKFLHVLGQLLKEWRAESAYASDDDFVFASRKLMGRKPRRGSVVVADHLKPAAVRAGVILRSQRRHHRRRRHGRRRSRHRRSVRGCTSDRRGAGDGLDGSSYAL